MSGVSDSVRAVSEGVSEDISGTYVRGVRCVRGHMSGVSGVRCAGGVRMSGGVRRVLGGYLAGADGFHM